MEVNKMIILLCCTLSVLFISCEEEFIQDDINSEERYVVESYVEVGLGASLPPYALLTKTVPYNQTITEDDLRGKFVHDANVMISNGTNEVELFEVCLNDLDSAIREQVKQELKLANFPDSIEFCVYLDLFNELKAEIGDKLNLTIEHEGNILTAETQTVPMVEADSLTFKTPAGEVPDDYKRLVVHFKDPAELTNFYQYKVSIDGSPYKNAPQSVADDNFINGKNFSFPLLNPFSKFEDINDATYGLFEVGDSISLQWITIPQDHYDFYFTLENSSNAAGPFTTYSRIISNVNGAFGVFGARTIVRYNAKVE